MCVLQGARILYERESTIDIDYSDLEDKLKKVLATTESIAFLPVTYWFVCMFVFSPPL